MQNSGLLRFCQQPRAAHALRLDQNNNLLEMRERCQTLNRHYETFACRMTILHYSLTKLSKRRVSGSIKLFIYSNEHFEMAQGQKSG